MLPYGSKNKAIAYNIGLCKLTGSMVSAVILQFIIQCWERDKKPIVWFNSPTDHPDYRTGRSWEESHGLSTKDLKYGMEIIGTRILKSTQRESVLKNSHPQFDIKGRLINSNELILYGMSMGRPYYELNHLLAEKAIELQNSGKWEDYIAPSTESLREIEKELKEKKQHHKKISNNIISAFADIDIIAPEIGKNLTEKFQ